MELNLALREYGLTENEIKIYLSLLKAGESSVQKAAKNASLPRTTAYHLLDSLEQKGLAGYVLKGSVKYFQAAEPKKLLSALEEKKKIIQEILPELSQISGSMKERPQVSIFEGVKGIRSILKDVLEEKKIIYHYGDLKSIQAVFAHTFPQYINERVKRKIPIRLIGKREEAHEDLIKNAKKEFREFLFIPENFAFKSSVFIYAGKVAIFNIKTEPYYAVLIENQDYYETQKNMFELVWSLSKK